MGTKRSIDRQKKSKKKERITWGGLLEVTEPLVATTDVLRKMIDAMKKSLPNNGKDNKTVVVSEMTIRNGYELRDAIVDYIDTKTNGKGGYTSLKEHEASKYMELMIDVETQVGEVQSIITAIVSKENSNEKQ